VLTAVLKGTLELLHPFMPFITEEIYHNMPEHGDTVMLESWPDGAPGDEKAVEQMQEVMTLIRAIRNIRAEFNVSPGASVECIMVVPDQNRHSLFRLNSYVQEMAKVSRLQVVERLTDKPRHAVSALTPFAEVYVPLEGIIDVNREVARLEKELKTVQTELEKAQAKLGNAGFLAKAPAEVVEKEKMKINEASLKKEGIEKRLAILKD
jgi:valyl-tRNA synthetase